ncbi:MAG: hypothetical protein GY838_18030 [bacterium]|nr:hypothetical protein [bacterium]
MKTLLTLIFVLALAGGAYAQTETHCYGWENGGDVLGCYNCDNAAYEVNGVHVTEGSSALAAADLGGSTPQLYVAWITGLNEGDVITVTADAWDDSPSANPAFRLWGHWTDDVDVANYVSSPGIGSDYSGATEWTELTAEWIIPAGIVALCVEARPYDSSPYGGYNWMDNLCVTMPEGANLHFPGGVVPTDDDATWSSIKAMFQ